MVLLDSLLFWTVVSAIAAVVAAVVAVLTVWINRQKKKEKKLEALEKLKQARNELCVAMNLGEINTLLNNAITICDEKKLDSKNLNDLWNQLQPVLTEVESKWNSLKLQLASSGNDKLSEQLDAVVQEYLFCFRDVESIVAALRCDKVDVIDGMVTSENSEELRGIIEATKPLYTDVYEFVKQVISLRFQDLDIPDFAAKIRQLWDDESKYEYNLNTRLFAVMGNPMTQNALGDYYYDQKQFKKALVWFEKAAEQDLAEAQFNLGFCFKEGYGVEKDEGVAFKWYKKAAEQGLAKAQYNLGICYHNGEGVEKDEREAFGWFLKSAEQDYSLAMSTVGSMYHLGMGIGKNEHKGFEYIKKAAELGVDNAQYNLGIIYIKGIICEKNEQKGCEWIKKAATQGYDIAQLELGKCYLNGTGVERNEESAFVWFLKSANQGLNQAQLYLGYCYENGIGVEINKKLMFEWYKKAAEQGNAEACVVIGNCYLGGIGCDQDYNKAFIWLNKARIEGDDKVKSVAYNNLGGMYFNGTIGLGDYFTAVSFFNIAANYGNDEAQYRLGFCNEKGIGVKEIDIEKAKYWYGEAAKQGNEEAIASLARISSN